eukprot:532287_1
MKQKNAIVTRDNGDEYNLISINCLSEKLGINETTATPDSNEINLLHINDKSCQHLNINGKFSKVINIICSANDSNLQICNDINIIRITISNEFTLEFDGYMTCKNMYIDVSNANIVNINTIINNENRNNVVLSNDKLKRERLSLLLKWLELRSNEGINNQASHNALGKIYISMNKNNAIHFLETNIFYNIEIIMQLVDNNSIKMNKLNGLLNQVTQYLKQDKLYNLQLDWLSTISLIPYANKSCAKDNIESQFNEQRILMNELKNEINDKQNTIGILIYKSNNICKPKYNKTIKNLKYENNILFKERDDALNGSVDGNNNNKNSNNNKEIEEYINKICELEAGIRSEGIVNKIELSYYGNKPDKQIYSADQLIDPLGWNIRVCVQQLYEFIDMFKEIPVKVIHFLIYDINYGGKVTYNTDRRT